MKFGCRVLSNTTANKTATFCFCLQKKLDDVVRQVAGERVARLSQPSQFARKDRSTVRRREVTSEGTTKNREVAILEDRSTFFTRQCL